MAKREKKRDPNDESGEISFTIDCAAIPELIELVSSLHQLRSDMRDAGADHWAERVDEIITKWEMNK